MGNQRRDGDGVPGCRTSGAERARAATGAAFGAVSGAPGAGGRGAVRSATTAAAVCALAFSLTSCGLFGSDDKDNPHQSRTNDIRIGLLLPEKEAARYEKFDRPVIEEQVKELTHGKGSVLYANAEQSAKKQKAQFERMIDEDVDTIIVDAVDAKAIGPDVQKAKDAGINVLAYDRLAEGPVDGYVTFDGELVGQVQGRALAAALGKDARDSEIVMMNGARTDPNAALFKRGALSELRSKVTIAKSYDTKAWKPKNARANMEAAIKQLGAENIDAVYSANDGMAGGVIQALKAAGVTPLPPVTGQDAELPAVRRIVTGEQYMTVYKPYREEAVSAARMAIKISQGRTIEFDALALDNSSNASTDKIPSHLVPVRPITQDSIKSTVIKDKIYSVEDICTEEYAAACQSIGLK